MKKLLYSLFVLFGLSGCSKILDKPTLTVITSQNFFKNGDDAESAITGCYDILQDDSYYGSSMNIMGETPGDNVTSPNSDIFSMDKIQWTSTTAYPSRIYQLAYKGINRANNVLQYVPGITINIQPDRRSQILGEAHFLRALHYFNLVKCYGGVPMPVKATESAASSAMPRASAADVYALIEKDLDSAAALLPASYGSSSLDRTRATSGAVNALQSKVFLYERKWPEAAAAADKVMTNTNYGTGITTPWNNLWPPKNKQESIFEVEYSGTADGSFTLPDLILPSPPAVYSFPKYNIPTAEFIGYIDTANDIRYKRVGPVPGGVQFGCLVFGGPGSGNDNGWFIYKWRSTNFFNSNDNYPILRLADVYLMYAEAINEQGGPSQAALDRLNAVRVRAGLPALTLASLATKQAFRDETDRQRRLELAFEGERWFDLVRYSNQILADPSAAHKVSALDIIQQQRGTRDVNYLLYPIPLNELNTNPDIKQNPGY